MRLTGAFFLRYNRHFIALRVLMQIHRLKGYIQEIYLVEYAHGLLLLDGMSRCDIDMLRRFITGTLGRPFTDLKLVVVTHMHPDHAGAAQALRKISGCRIASADKKRQWYGGLHGAGKLMVDMYLAHWMAAKMKKARRNIWYWPYLRPDYRLRHGDALPGFDDWCVLETPGHTDRDLSLYHAESRTAYTADLILKLKRGLAVPFPVFLPQAYRASLQQMADLQPHTLLLAHGGEIQPEAADFGTMLALAPTQPLTLLASIRRRIHNHLNAFSPR